MLFGTVSKSRREIRSRKRGRALCAANASVPFQTPKNAYISRIYISRTPETQGRERERERKRETLLGGTKPSTKRSPSFQAVHEAKSRQRACSILLKSEWKSAVVLTVGARARQDYAARPGEVVLVDVDARVRLFVVPRLRFALSFSPRHYASRRNPIRSRYDTFQPFPRQTRRASPTRTLPIVTSREPRHPVHTFAPKHQKT